jgi:2-polyprenyl-6-methoxyphenol hydroxylase-like FAD-dependent oxidoreductase
MVFERARFIEMLYENLSEKSKIKTSRCVIGVEQDENGVKVQVNDGTYVTGDIVIGADGVHSFIRGQMWNEGSKGTLTGNTVAAEDGKLLNVKNNSYTTNMCQFYHLGTNVSSVALRDRMAIPHAI